MKPRFGSTSFFAAFVFAAVLSTGFAGCSLWADFTTYFNLYYNADEMFTEAETAIREQRRDPFITYDTPLPGSSSTLLDKVVEKCSKILQFNSQSNLVDDALMMLGKSFFYQRNYIKAKRKFQELIGTRAESDLKLEAGLWLAKTEMQMKNFPDGLAMLEDIHKTAKEEGRTEILAETYIEQIKYFLVTEDFENAIKRCKDFLEVSDDDNLNSRAAFQIAELFAAQKSYRSARDYYFMAYDKFAPSFELGFSARSKYGKMLLQTGESEAAEKIFRALRSEDKYREFYDQIDFSFILSDIRQGNFTEAYAKFTAFDTTYPSSTQLGNARYEMGYMFEKQEKNYDSAFTLYQKASSSTATAEYLPLIRERAQTFSKYRALVSECLDLRKMEVYVADSTAFIKDSLEYYKTDSVIAAPQDSIVYVERYTGIGGERERVFNFGDESTAAPQEPAAAAAPVQEQQQLKGAPPKRPTISPDSIRTSLAKNAYELGNIFFTYLEVPDSVRYYYEMALTRYSGSPYEAKTLYALGNYYRESGNGTIADSLFRVIYTNHKSDRIVNEAAKKLSLPEIDFDFDPAKKQYSEAEMLYLRKSYDSAYSAMVAIYQNHPSSAFAVKALYAGAFILEDGLKLYDSAAVVYDSLVTKHPSTVFAQKVAPKLQFYKQEKQRIAQFIADSLRRIEDSVKAIRDSIAAKDSLRIQRKVSADSSAVTDTLKQSDSLKAPVNPKIKTEEGEEKPPEEVNPDETKKPAPPIEREKYSGVYRRYGEYSPFCRPTRTIRPNVKVSPFIAGVPSATAYFS